MKRYLSTITSMLVLAVTALLLVVTMFSWYASNNDAKVDEVSGATAGDTKGFKFEYYSVDLDEHGDPIGWVDVDTIDDATGSLWPHDVVYFRFKLLESSSSSSCKLTATFKNVESKVDTEDGKVTFDDDIVYYEGVEVYEIEDDKVIVEEDDILYTVENEKLNLADYKIQDAIKVNTNPSIAANGTPIIIGDEFKSMDETIFSSATITKDAPLYFALYYADGSFEEANVSGGFLEDTAYYTYTVVGGFKKVKNPTTPVVGTKYYTYTADEEISPYVNYYQYQRLNIGQIVLTA